MLCGYVNRQVVLGLPFLLTYPWSYVSKAFEFSRVFQHVWTVNLKFLPPEVSPCFCVFACDVCFVLDTWLVRNG